MEVALAAARAAVAQPRVNPEAKISPQPGLVDHFTHVVIVALGGLMVVGVLLAATEITHTRRRRFFTPGPAHNNNSNNQSTHSTAAAAASGIGLPNHGNVNGVQPPRRAAGWWQWSAASARRRHRNAMPGATVTAAGGGSDERNSNRVRQDVYGRGGETSPMSKASSAVPTPTTRPAAPPNAESSSLLPLLPPPLFEIVAADDPSGGDDATPAVKSATPPRRYLLVPAAAGWSLQPEASASMASYVAFANYSNNAGSLSASGAATPAAQPFFPSGSGWGAAAAEFGASASGGMSRASPAVSGQATPQRRQSTEMWMMMRGASPQPRVTASPGVATTIVAGTRGFYACERRSSAAGAPVVVTRYGYDAPRGGGSAAIAAPSTSTSLFTDEAL